MRSVTSTTERWHLLTRRYKWCPLMTVMKCSRAQRPPRPREPLCNAAPLHVFHSSSSHQRFACTQLMHEQDANSSQLLHICLQRLTRQAGGGQKEDTLFARCGDLVPLASSRSISWLPAERWYREERRPTGDAAAADSPLARHHQRRAADWFLLSALWIIGSPPPLLCHVALSGMN